jgi:hypothetical protein
MAGYLEAYGASEEHRAQRLALLKRLGLIVVRVLIVAVVLYAVSKNYSEERQVKTFLATLQRKDYGAAYRMWGCTESTPCRDYSFARFSADWGPNSPNAKSSPQIGTSQSCGSGVILRLDYPNAEPVPLWVERSTGIISFAPWPECPGRHLHLGAFFRSLFGR